MEHRSMIQLIKGSASNATNIRTALRRASGLDIHASPGPRAGERCADGPYRYGAYPPLPQAIQPAGWVRTANTYAKLASPMPETYFDETQVSSKLHNGGRW